MSREVLRGRLRVDAMTFLSLDDLIRRGAVELGRGNIISRRDLRSEPGDFPVYSSAKENGGLFGRYGRYMFDEELITWSIDGGGRLFHRPKHKFSVTNVGGFLRIKDRRLLNYRYLFYVLSALHRKINFDWIRKAHPSVIRTLYKQISVPSLSEQQRTVEVLDKAFENIAIAIANTEKNIRNASELVASAIQDILQPADGWMACTLGDLIDIKHGFAFRSQYFRNVGPYVLLTPGNFFENGGFRQRGEKQKYYVGDVPAGYVLRKNDLLIAMTEQAPGLLGSPAIVPDSDLFLHNQRLGLVTVKQPKRHSKRFLFHIFNLPHVRAQISATSNGVKVRHTSPTKIAAVRVLVPPSKVDEERLVQRIEQLKAGVNGLSESLSSKLIALSQLHESLLAGAVSSNV